MTKYYNDYERGKIGNMMYELFKEYGKDKFYPKSKKEFEEAVNIIEENLNNFSDENVVKEFYCLRDDDSDFVNINALVKKRTHEIICNNKSSKSMI